LQDLEINRIKNKNSEEDFKDFTINRIKCKISEEDFKDFTINRIKNNKKILLIIQSL
jgi:hypothetical protein